MITGFHVGSLRHKDGAAAAAATAESCPLATTDGTCPTATTAEEKKDTAAAGPRLPSITWRLTDNQAGEHEDVLRDPTGAASQNFTHFFYFHESAPCTFILK